MIRSTLLLLAFALPTSAQTGAVSVFGPITGAFDLDGDAWAVDTGGGASGVAVTRHRGRTPVGEGGVGFEYTQLHFNDAAPAVPTRLIRVEAALGYVLDEIDLGGHAWLITGTAGAGVASSAPGSDADGLYTLGSVMGSVKRWGGTVRVGLTWDGNRSVLPDVPLPVLAYERDSDIEGGEAELGLTLGYPTSRVTWRPSPGWTLSAGLDRLDAVSADVRFALTDTFALTAAYGGFYDQFHVEDDNPNRRVFFVSQRFEAGAELSGDWGRVGLSGGYALGQELRRGWDLRDTDIIAEFDDGPFVRVAWRVGF